VKGVGCDCLGLVRGVRRALTGEDETPPPYRPDWAEVLDGEPLLQALGARLVEIAPERARPGDVLVFRMAQGAAAKHCAILSAEAEPGGEARMIHAYWGRAVVESWQGPWWRRRTVAAFTWEG
jgi:NlpC/P60 family putative phage cell wall peptidase